MFTTEQVKGFILHPEPIVSNTALQYFADSFLYENDTTLMPLVLERMKQSGDAGTVHLPHTYKFPLTEEVIRELLALYQSPTIDKNTKFHLQIILRHCSPEQSIPFMELVEQDPSWQKLLVQKSNLANLDDQELLDVFKVFIEQSTGKSWGEFDTAYGDEIVNELSRRRCMDTEAVLQRLRDNDPHDPSYEVPYLIQLAGLMKLEAAILVLCGFSVLRMTCFWRMPKRRSFVSGQPGWLRRSLSNILLLKGRATGCMPLVCSVKSSCPIQRRQCSDCCRENEISPTRLYWLKVFVNLVQIMGFL